MREGGSSWQDGTSATHCAILQWGQAPLEPPMALGASLLAPERQKAERHERQKGKRQQPHG